MPRAPRSCKKAREYQRQETKRLLREGLSAQPEWLLRKLGLEEYINPLTSSTSNCNSSFTELKSIESEPTSESTVFERQDHEQDPNSPSSPKDSCDDSYLSCCRKPPILSPVSWQNRISKQDSNQETVSKNITPSKAQEKSTEDEPWRSRKDFRNDSPAPSPKKAADPQKDYFDTSSVINESSSEDYSGEIQTERTEEDIRPYIPNLSGFHNLPVRCITRRGR